MMVIELNQLIVCQASASFFSATAMMHDLIVVTKNVSDFEHSQVRVENPWV